MALKKRQEEETEEEFKDDFEEDEFEDEKERPVAKKPLPKKPQKDEYDEEEEKVEFEEEEPKETRGRPKGTFRKPQVQTANEPMEERFSPYHISQRDGIKDNKTNQSIGEDLMTLLASIKNDLQELKVGLIGDK
jgi:hypothetical protein